MDVKIATERLEALQAEYEQARLNLAALQGAIQDAEWFLAQLGGEEAPDAPSHLNLAPELPGEGAGR